MIKFTIVTCTYNAASVLQRTLDSVLCQKYADVEHLILDGLSKDDTVRMALAYKERSEKLGNDHDVVVISEKDGGLYDAMNKGIRHATGDYIVFLNAGDTFPDSDTLDTIASSIGDGEQLPGVLYGDTNIVDMDHHFLRHRRLTPPKRLTWRSFKLGMLVCHQAFYARTDLAKETLYNNEDYRFSADVDWCIRIMKLCAKRHLALRNVNAVIVDYLDGGMTNKNHNASLKERFHVMAKHYGYVQTVFLHLFFALRSVVKR
jgi:glycosyltransferase involved in cell wall biosynthesis